MPSQSCAYLSFQQHATAGPQQIVDIGEESLQAFIAAREMDGLSNVETAQKAKTGAWQAPGRRCWEIQKPGRQYFSLPHFKRQNLGALTR